MTTPRQIAELAALTAGVDGLEDSPDELIVRAPLDDANIRTRWLAVRAAPPAYLDQVTIVEADGDAELANDAPPAAGSRFRITLRKRLQAGQLRLFFARSLGQWMERTQDADVVLLGDLGADETFSTRRNRYELWTLDAPEPAALSEPLPDPRAYCADFTGRETPADLRPWLLRNGPARAGEAYDLWRTAAAKHLLASLCDRVSDDEGRARYHFSGPPSRAFSLSDAEIAAVHDRLQEAAKWVFAEARDADTRHLFLAAELARTYRSGAHGELGEGSLDSAKAAYSAYVKAGSKETLKALTELRRAVVEEGQKAAQRAQDLAGSMWKDIAVAAVPFVLKFLPDASKPANQLLAGLFALIAAAFLVFSFLTQIHINRRFFRTQKAARTVWKRALATALTPTEIEEFSETPIQNGLSDYRSVRAAVGTFYSILVLVLVIYAAANFYGIARPPPLNARADALSTSQIEPPPPLSADDRKRDARLPVSGPPQKSAGTASGKRD